MILKISTGFGIAIAVLANVSNAATEDAEAVYGGDEVLSLATGYQVPVQRAPATATILTRSDLDLYGARTLKDALDLVAGFHIATADGRSTFSTVRGITSRVLVLVDDVPVNRTMIDPWVGFDNFLLHNVERIEIVRGPGSAVYGADATAGVINIKTKTASGIAGDEVGAIGGDNSSYDAWGLLHGQLGAVDFGAFASYSTTDGARSTVEADAQTVIDQRLGTKASHAPGVFEQERQSIDVRFDARVGDLTARATYYKQDPMQVGAGVAYALDPDGEWSSVFKSAQLIYDTELSETWRMNTYVDLSQVEQIGDATVFPPGAFGNTFPDGVRSSFTIENDRARAEMTLLFSGFDGHVLRFGGGASENEFDNVKDVRNFVVRNGRFVPTGQFAQFGGVGDAGLLGDTDQRTVFAYVQDEWRLAKDWTLTSGVRWDDYSDFGSATNPRIGLVWNTLHNLTLKALYGRSFRPPSIFESQSSGVFSAKGDPDLNPTTLDMVELGLVWELKNFEIDASVYRYKQGDLIQVVPDLSSPNRTAYVNRGSNDGWGFESIFAFQPTQRIGSTLSYAYQDRVGSTANDNANIRFQPHHILLWNTDVQIGESWRGAISARSVLDRERPESDPRPRPDDYVHVNAVLGFRPASLGILDVSLVVENVLDEDIRDPSPSPSTLPYDIPLPGRTWFVQLRAQW